MSEEKTDPFKAITPVARLSFAQLFRPRAMNSGGEPKYSCILVFDQEAQKDPRYKEMQRAAQAAAKEKFGDNLPKKFRNPFRDGEEKEELDGFEPGFKFISVSTKQKPGVVNRKKEEIDEDEIKSGDYVIASIRAFAYDREGNRGVSFGLNNILKVREGEALGGGRQSADKDFADIELPEGDDDDINDDPFA